MKVWIDQDLCTGDGLCEEIAPAVFTLLDDGLAYVKEDGDVKSDPGGSGGHGRQCRPTWTMPSSRPPRSAPANASSSSATEPLRAPPTGRRPSGSVGVQPASRGEKPGVADHTVVGPYRAGLDVPGAPHDLLCLGEPEGRAPSSSA